MSNQCQPGTHSKTGKKEGRVGREEGGKGKLCKTLRSTRHSSTSKGSVCAPLPLSGNKPFLAADPTQQWSLHREGLAVAMTLAFSTDAVCIR